jgi:hypothetical protein
MSSLHGDFILQRSVPAPALESAQAALQGVQVLMTRQGGRNTVEMGGMGEGGRVCIGSTEQSSASNEGLKGSTHSTIDPIELRQSRRCQANSSPLGEQ